MNEISLNQDTFFGNESQQLLAAGSPAIRSTARVFAQAGIAAIGFIMCGQSEPGFFRI